MLLSMLQATLTGFSHHPLTPSSPRNNFSVLFCFASMEICDPRNNITMCPLCDHACSYWKLVTACGTAQASHLFDNPATVFFSIFMALWGADTFVIISKIEAS